MSNRFFISGSNRPNILEDLSKPELDAATFVAKLTVGGLGVRTNTSLDPATGLLPKGWIADPNEIPISALDWCIKDDAKDGKEDTGKEGGSDGKEDTSDGKEGASDGKEGEKDTCDPDLAGNIRSLIRYGQPIERADFIRPIM